jgi:hypothetical protein
MTISSVSACSCTVCLLSSLPCDWLPRLSHSVWQTTGGTAKAGHGSEKGGWYINYYIPFSRSVRVTLELPGTAPGVAWVIVRGCENLPPVKVGAVQLPPTARLKLHKIVAKTFLALEFVPIVEIPDGDGLIYMHTISANSTQASFCERGRRTSSAAQCLDARVSLSRLCLRSVLLSNKSRNHVLV